MDIFGIVIVALTATILAITVKGRQPEIAVLISITAGTMIFIKSSTYLKSIFEVLIEIADRISLDLSFVFLLLKIIGISYVSEFSSQLCKDAGQSAIASKIELAGKILILFSSAPIILSVLELMSDII